MWCTTDQSYAPFGGVKKDEEGTTYTYDGFDRTKTVHRSAQEVATYSYDGLDRRREAHQPGASPEQVFLHHAGLGPTLLGERVATGTDTSYTHSGGMPPGRPPGLHRRAPFIRRAGQRLHGDR